MEEIEIIGLDGEVTKIGNFQEEMIEENKWNFLNPKLCTNLRDAINSSTVFLYDPKYLAQYNLSCAVMDRLDTCISKLEQYGDYPESEEELLSFMMFSCMVVDAVQEIIMELTGCKREDLLSGTNEDYKFFGDIYKKSEIYNPNVEMPVDDKFFEYLRSLMFAHPFETSRAKFLKPKEKQYSPWVIVNNAISGLLGAKDLVGVRIYSNQSENIIDLHFPFSTLKSYIASRYERIQKATEWVKEQIRITEENWKKVKVNRFQDAIDVFKEIKGILISRYEDASSSQEAIECLECENSIEKK